MSNVDTSIRSQFPPLTPVSDRRPDGSELVSYRTLRRVVGILGVSLPVVLAVWGLFLTTPISLLPSISDYYSLRTRDVFVGVLFTIAWFLFTYRGFDRRDSVAGNLACVFALGVALFPNSGTKLEGAVHFASAVLLFLVLAYFSLKLFTQSDGAPTRQKILRNRVYRTCGWVMLACIAVIAVCKVFFRSPEVERLSVVFWFETFALWAFGVSWFVKGETILKDKAPARSLRS
jgi:hypothetical protein